MSQYNTNENVLNVPPLTLASIDRYVAQGTPTGWFLYAVLTNDLKGAVTRADLSNPEHLYAIVLYLLHHCPEECWGSEAAVQRWREKHKRS